MPANLLTQIIYVSMNDGDENDWHDDEEAFDKL
jgi:hypothetical protein